MKDDEVLRGVRVSKAPKVEIWLLNSLSGDWWLTRKSDVRAASN